MRSNVGTFDRAIRVGAGVLIGAIVLFGHLPEPAGIILGIAALVFLATGAMRFCPLYGLCSISTHHSPHNEKKGT